MTTAQACAGDLTTVRAWFTEPTDVDAPHGAAETIREAILNELDRASHVAVCGDEVMVATPSMRVSMIRHENIVRVDAVCCYSLKLIDAGITPGGHWKFHMNASSLKQLGDALRATPRADHSLIFAGGPLPDFCDWDHAGDPVDEPEVFLSIS